MVRLDELHISKENDHLLECLSAAFVYILCMNEAIDRGFQDLVIEIILRKLVKFAAEPRLSLHL